MNCLSLFYMHSTKRAEKCPIEVTDSRNQRFGFIYNIYPTDGFLGSQIHVRFPPKNMKSENGSRNLDFNQFPNECTLRSQPSTFFNCYFSLPRLSASWCFYCYLLYHQLLLCAGGFDIKFYSTTTSTTDIPHLTL